MYNMLHENYVGPAVSVDTVVFQLIADRLYVLLVERKSEPFKGQLALPGGYNPIGETTYQAAVRTLHEKTGVIISKIRVVEQLYTFDTLQRDPRGHAISVTYLGLTRNLTPLAGGTTEYPQFFPVDALPESLAYDHIEIIKYALDRLRSKLFYTNAIFALIPKLFTLTQLQNAYETILGQKFDKRNFRKKFLGLNLIQETKEMIAEGAHRPARLYRFNHQKLEYLSRSFE